jgi:hypothetical protein
MLKPRDPARACSYHLLQTSIYAKVSLYKGLITNAERGEGQPTLPNDDNIHIPFVIYYASIYFFLMTERWTIPNKVELKRKLKHNALGLMERCLY